MAGSLRGIVLDIGGDTSNLARALQDVDRQAKTSQDALKQIESALKFDPGSTDLLTAKQKELQSALTATETRLDMLRQADRTAKQQLDSGQIGIADYAKLQTEIGQTERKLKGLQDQASGNLAKQQTEMRRAGDAVKDLDVKQTALTERMRLAEQQYRETGDETKFAADRASILSEQVDNQNQKVSEARNALDAAKDAYGENSKAAKFYQDTLDTAERELGEYERSLKQATDALAYQTSELPKAERELAELDRTQEKLNSEMKMAEAQFKLTGDQTALQSERVRILSEQTDTQEKKVAAANLALEEATRLYGEGDERVEQYAKELTNANIGLVEMQAELKKANADLEESTSKLNKVAGKLEEFGGKMESVGKGLSVGVTAPLMGIAAAAGVAWKEIDDAYDGIATSSGALGDELADLQKSFDAVYKKIPVDAAMVGEAIGEINTHFGLTGALLEDATEKTAKFATINATSVSASVLGAKGVISALNMETEDYGRVLDAVTVAAQDTGKSTDSLFQALRRGAPQINDLNLSVEDAAQLFGRMEQAGLESTRVIGGLTRAQGDAAKDGKTLNQVLSAFTELVETSTDETEVMNRAVELFGTRNGPAMAQAARQGVLDFSALADSARDVGGAVEATFEATLDPIDHAQVAMNNLKLAGSELFTAIQVAGTPALEGLVKLLQDGTQKLSEMNPETLDLAVKIGAVAIAAGPTLTVLGKMTTGAGQLVTGIGRITAAIGEKGLAGGLGSLIGPGGKIMLAVAAIGLLAVAAKKMHDELQPGTKAIRDMVTASSDMADGFDATENGLKQTADIAREITDELRKYEKQTRLTSDEQARMALAVDQLNRLYPDLNLSIDEQTGLLSESVDAIDRRIDAMERELLFEAYQERQLEQLKQRAEMEYELEEALKQVEDARDAVSNATDKEIAMLFAGQKMYGEVGDAMIEYAYGVTEAEQNVELLTEEIKKQNDRITHTGDLMRDAQKDINNYGATQEQTADKVETANKKQQDSEDELIDKLLEANKERRKLQAESADAIDDYYAELERAQGNYVSAIQAFGDKEFNLRKATAEELKNYQQEMLKAYLEYEANMNVLSKKVPADVLTEMRKLGPDGAHLIQEYVNMTDEELQPYIDTWSTVTETAMEAARTELKKHPGASALIAQDSINQTRRELRKGIDSAREAARDTVQAYTDTATGMPRSARDKSRETVDAVDDELKKGAGKARAQAAATGDSYSDGMRSKQGAAASAAASIATSAGAALNKSGWADGANLGETFRQGILSKISVVKGAGAALGNAAPTGLKNVLQIKSPSRVMRGLADDTADGYELQLYDRRRDIEKAGRALVDPLATMDTMLPDIPQLGMRAGAVSLGGYDQAQLGLVADTLTRYLPQLANLQVVMDSGEVVGVLAPGMNDALGRQLVADRRGI